MRVADLGVNKFRLPLLDEEQVKGPQTMEPTRVARLAVALALIMLAGCAAQQPTQPEIFVPYPEGGVALGWGWDTAINGTTRALCVDINPQEGRYLGYKADFSSTELIDFDSLYTSFSASAEASLASIGSGNLAYSDELTTTNNDIYLAARYAAVYGAKFAVPPPRELNWFEKLLKALFGIEDQDKKVAAETYDNDPMRAPIDGTSFRISQDGRDHARVFRSHCGNYFVSSIIKGAGFTGMYKLHTFSLSEKQNLSGNAKVDISGVVSASGNAQKIVDSVRNSSNITVVYSKYGNLPPSACPAKSDTCTPYTEEGFKSEIAAAIRSPGNMPSDIENAFNAGAPIVVGLTPYTNVGDYADVVDTQQGIAETEMTNQWYRLKYLYLVTDDMAKDSDRSAAPCNPDALTPDESIPDHQFQAPGQTYHWDNVVTPAGLVHVRQSMFDDMAKLNRALLACASGSACQWPDGVERDDYRYRAQLPVSKQYLSLAPGSLSLDDAVYSLNKFKKDDWDAAGDQKQGWASTYATKKQDLCNVINRVDQLDASSQRYAYWIDSANTQRCKANFQPFSRVQPACLDPEMEACVKAKMTAGLSDVVPSCR